MTIRTALTKARHVAADTGRFGGVAVVFLVLMLPWAWGISYVGSNVQHIAPDRIVSWFAGAALMAMIAGAFLLAGLLIQDRDSRMKLDGHAVRLFTAATWVLAAAMLQWVAVNLREIYTAFAVPPWWIDDWADRIDWIAPAPIGLAFYTLFSPVIDRMLQTPPQHARPQRPQPFDPARN